MRTAWCYSSLVGLLTLSVTVGIDAHARNYPEKAVEILTDSGAELGSYTRAMSPAETMAFVQKQQSLWAPVLTDIARQEAEK
jgi:hypothetical protein